MSSICHHFFCHHKYTPYAHFCRFRFPFTSPLSLCTRKPHFTILNPFASARVNRPGTGTTKYGFLQPKGVPFQPYNFQDDRRTPSADAPSAQRESIRIRMHLRNAQQVLHRARVGASFLGFGWRLHKEPKVMLECTMVRYFFF